jgi:hypothetical protein
MHCLMLSDAAFCMVLNPGMTPVRPTLWQVADVLAVSLGRVLLLTDSHIIMLRSSRAAGGGGGGGGGRAESSANDGEEGEPDYRHKWRVRTSEVQAIKGDWGGWSGVAAAPPTWPVTLTISWSAPSCCQSTLADTRTCAALPIACAS